MRKEPNGKDDAVQEARVARLRDFHPPSLEAIERRRAQLWLRMALGLVAVVGSTTFLSAWGAGRVFVLEASEVRSAILVVALISLMVAAVREMSLSRLTRELTNERVLTAALTARLHEVELLLEAGREMNAQLELPVLLQTILRSATDLLQAGGGSVMLLHGDELVTAAARGRDEAREARVLLGEGVVGRVALRREPVLIDGYADPDVFPGLADREPYVRSAMCLPLVYGERMQGVLNVNAPSGSAFTEHDLRALSVFADQAAMAIAHALELERVRSGIADLRQRERGAS